MNTLAVLILCIQACLVQNIFGQCLGRYGTVIAPAAALRSCNDPCGAAFGPAAGFTPFGYGAELGFPAASGLSAPYGGVGEGNVAVVGELPVVGTTAVAGQVPIMGAVRFAGDVAAAGAVSIAGSCTCGCAGVPYLY